MKRSPQTNSEFLDSAIKLSSYTLLVVLLISLNFFKPSDEKELKKENTINTAGTNL